MGVNNLAAVEARGERVMPTPAEVKAYLSRLQREATGSDQPKAPTKLIDIPGESRGK